MQGTGVSTCVEGWSERFLSRPTSTRTLFASHQGLPDSARHVIGCRLNSVSEGLVLIISSDIDGIFAQGSRPGRTFCKSVGGIIEMDSSDWSNGI